MLTNKNSELNETTSDKKKNQKAYTTGTVFVVVAASLC
jgi:hypothetical protein